MENEFVAFVDEAGCSGNRFGKGSSEFLAMAAIVCRRSNLDQTLDVFDDARAKRDMQDKKFKKFSKSSDKDNFVLTSLLAAKPVRFVFVAFHKPSLQGTSIRENHGNEYNYLTKFVIERISWTVRDAKHQGGNKICDVVMSEQKMYPMENLEMYFEKLKQGKGRYNTRANWEHIGTFSQMPHNDETETHLADIAASAFHRAIEPKEYGMTDERFFNNLFRLVYRGREDRPHGLKIWPNEVIEPAKKEGRLLFLDR